jgi:cytoskeletal protein CcmA (bactofilin family)
MGAQVAIPANVKREFQFSVPGTDGVAKGYYLPAPGSEVWAWPANAKHRCFNALGTPIRRRPPGSDQGPARDFGPKALEKPIIAWRTHIAVHSATRSGALKASLPFRAWSRNWNAARRQIEKNVGGRNTAIFCPPGGITMFKRSDTEDGRSEPTIHSSEPAIPSTTRSRTTATIGPSIQISGDVTGNEDVRIEGRVEGTVNLSDNVLTIGKEGQINATANARVIFVEGKVEGDLKADEQIVVQSSGNVRGNIIAPRVTLEDGCKFKGSIDMDVEPSTTRASSGAGRSEKIADIKSAAGGSGDSSSAGGLGKAPGQ